MIPRVLEPEVMDTPLEAADYDAMDHTQVNRVFVDDLLKSLKLGAGHMFGAPLLGAGLPTPPGDGPEVSQLTGQSSAEHVDRSGDRSTTRGHAATELLLPLTVLDVGTGTAQIPIELCRRAEFAGNVVAVDLADAMLQLARRNVEAAALSSCIRVERVDAKRLPFESGAFDVVMSNSIVHHIPNPLVVLWEMVRALRPAGMLFVRDLLRPVSEAQIEHIVATYAGAEPVHSQQLFRQSLWAALTLAETQDLATACGLPRNSVRPTSDRHWTLVWRKPV